MPLIFDVFEADDLGGTALGELTHAFDKRIRTELNGFGAGSFRINRHSAQVAWCEPDNLVRVKLTALGSYVFAFFIGEGEDEAVSPDEEGGEVFSRGGRGALAYLSRAIIYPPSDVDGNRHWEDDQFGDVLNDLLDEAQTRGALADMSWDFTGTDDSDSVAWPSFDGEFVLPLGMDLLSVTAKLQSLGLEVWMQPDLTLSAYNTRGSDKTGTVHFSKGVNIREGGTRRIHASPVKSRVMVQGRSSAGALKYREVIHAGTEADARIGRRESFTQYAASGSNAMLDLAGARYLEASRDQHAGPIQLGVHSASLVPFTDYSEGDTVALTIAGLYTASEQRISAITLEETASGEYDVTLDLGGIAYESLPPGDTSGGGSGGGLPGGDGGGVGTASPWVLFLEESGGSIADWTELLGAWSVSGGEIVGDADTDDMAILYLTERYPIAAMMMEAEIKVPAAATGNFGILIDFEDDGGPTERMHGHAVYLQVGADAIYWTPVPGEVNALVQQTVNNQTNPAAIDDDTWYKLRVARIGQWLNVWLDDVLYSTFAIGEAFPIDTFLDFALTGAINGVNTTFVSANPFHFGTTHVYLNGMKLRRGVDYTETDSETITMTDAPVTGDTLWLEYRMLSGRSLNFVGLWVWGAGAVAHFRNIRAWRLAAA